MDNSCFYWRTTGTDWGLILAVVTEKAFICSKTSQQLRITFEYDHLQIPIAPDVVRLRQRAAITPRIVRLAIEKAKVMTPPFTGEIGVPDIVLAPPFLGELQEEAKITLPTLP